MQNNEAVAHKTHTSSDLKDVIVQSILDKHGGKLISLDLRHIEEAVTDFFIVCHADSSVQIKAIYKNVIKDVKAHFGENPWHKEGIHELEWVLLDYVNVVVHVFLEDKRKYYNIEELWQDAEITYHEE